MSINDESPKMRTLNVYIEHPFGTMVDEVEVPADASQEELAQTAEISFLNTCSFGFGWKDENES